MSKKEPIILGWRELVSLPDWGLVGIHAKIDTGARTSALHVEEVGRIDKQKVEFVLVHDGVVRRFVAPLVRVSRVKPSSGELQERYVVETTIEIGPLRQRAEISLSSRETMLAPMLVGRRALRSKVLVDPRRRYLHGRPERVERDDRDER